MAIMAAWLLSVAADGTQRHRGGGAGGNALSVPPPKKRSSWVWRLISAHGERRLEGGRGTGSKCCKLPLKAPKEDKRETQEVTPNQPKCCSRSAGTGGGFNTFSLHS